MIFQSLGSNYSFNDLLQASFGTGTQQDVRKLGELLATRYDGHTKLFYKCREAMAEGMKLLGKKPVVGIIGFTCYAVYQAVEAADGTAVYIDLQRDSLNFSVEQLKVVHKKNPKMAAVVVQNTLGIPAPIAKIREYCDRHALILIEDLAHSIGAKYADGAEVGTVGDMVCLSFSRDKVVDAVSGGALVVRNESLASKLSNSQPKKLNKSLAWHDRIYPFLASLVRNNYTIGLGKLYHKVFIRLGAMQKATDATSASPAQAMPSWNARAALNGFSELESRAAHRIQIARIYAEQLPKSIQLREVTSMIDRSSNLRFPIVVKDRAGLTQHLRKFGVHVSDTWYDSPVAPPRHLGKTNYRTGECPVAEMMTRHIMNLPTHRGVSPAMAKLIAQRINTWR